jgi:hypothetical protein
MPELQAMTPPVAHEVAGEAEPAWSATKTLWTAWLMPAATARHATRLPLWRAWCAHLLALLLAALLFEFFVCWDFEWNLDQARSSFMNLLGELINAFAQRPVETTVATVTLFIGIELAFLVLAGAVTAWAARDERLRSSFAHALRQTWLHTAKRPRNTGASHIRSRTTMLPTRPRLHNQRRRPRGPRVVRTHGENTEQPTGDTTKR